MEKKQFYIALHKQLAKKYDTMPEIISYVRNYGLAKFKLIPMQTNVEEALVKIDLTISLNENAIRKLELSTAPQLERMPFELKKDKIQKIEEQIRLNKVRKEFLMDVYVFLHRIGDKAFFDITRRVAFKKL